MGGLSQLACSFIPDGKEGGLLHTSSWSSDRASLNQVTTLCIFDIVRIYRWLLPFSLSFSLYVCSVGFPTPQAFSRAAFCETEDADCVALMLH